jgi:methylphosphotriester-DNA--protein-cysteine methyltransferase
MDSSPAWERLAAIHDWPERALKAGYRCDRLAKDLDRNPMHVRSFFIRKFKRNPKEQLRIFRVDEIKRQLAKGECLKNIRVALGYFDLAHLTHDFQAIVGMAPHEWLRNGTTHPLERRAHRLAAHLSGFVSLS